MADKIIQFKDKDNNNLYPLILGDSIPNNGIEVSKLSKSVHDKINEDITNALSNYKSVEVVNDLTTGGTDKALSAEMGKKLSNNISTLSNKVASLEENTGSSSSSGSSGSPSVDDATHITLKGTTQRINVKTITNLHVTKQGYVMAA